MGTRRPAPAVRTALVAAIGEDERDGDDGAQREHLDEG
jgi:hypothetical protein